MAKTSSSAPFDITLGLDDTHVLVTGGCGLIGRVVVQAFLSAGSRVTVLDLLGTEKVLDLEDGKLHFVAGDITKDVDAAFTKAEERFGTVCCCIALASLDLSVLEQKESLCDVDPKVWQRVFDVNINGTFLTCQRWLQGIRSTVSSQNAEKRNAIRNISCIIIGSEAGRFGVRTMAAYAAGKSAVQYGLLQSLARDAPRIYEHARVNAVAPGAVDTERFRQEAERFGPQWRYEECEATVPMGRAVGAEDVARTVVFLASERFAGGVSGQLVSVDGGKGGTVCWGREELAERRGEGRGV
ncbi:hypothetical protein LTR56_001732 [Elasticomyces elasticus]|nr:hypothetical protein LTR22_020357 [Elasticomyces elasticus]KAK3658861.1 hypothetical protein LTR56_001732 [Elasticomyces elasticus]KAK4932704.1 hypothetical protein LTR49_001128 [Elasticomyces elasticus]KAK5769726.1 hypothetical protein LTS12_000176 [Elasticomyces elasticus]